MQAPALPHNPHARKHSTKRQTVQISGWGRQQLKEALRRLAESESISFSQTVISILENGVVAKLHIQQEILAESIMPKKGRVSGRRQKRISATSNTGEAGVQATARHNTGTEETFVAVHSRCIAMSMAYPLNGLIHPTIFS